MKKFALVLTTLLVGTQLSACSSRSTFPAQQALVPQQSAVASSTQFGSQSILGINKELTKAVQANFAAKDADKDGVIIPGEFPVESPEDFNHFRKLDKNKDGQIKISEMTSNIIGRAADIVQLKATAAFLFHELDVDRNRRLTATEITGSKIPGVAGNFSNYLGKSLITRRPLDYLRKTDFENLMAFALSNPEAAAKAAAEAAAKDGAGEEESAGFSATPIIGAVNQGQ